jgi:hypothetical protein
MRAVGGIKGIGPGRLLRASHALSEPVCQISRNRINSRRVAIAWVELIAKASTDARPIEVDPRISPVLRSDAKCSFHCKVRGLNNGTISLVTESRASVLTCLCKLYERQHSARLSSVVEPPFASGII